MANHGGSSRSDFTWVPSRTPEVAREEYAAASVFRAMLADPDWLIPLVAAQVQYRSVYYGMTAAALLEDVWTDALANWLARHRPSVSLTKVARGALGDYKVDDLVTSHKSGLGPSQTAIHWDATANRGPLWRSETAVTYLAAEYGGKVGHWTSASVDGDARVVWPVEANRKPKGPIALVNQSEGDWVVSETWAKWPSFADAWPRVAELIDQGIPAYDIEMMWLPEGVKVGDRGQLNFANWPGVYLWPKGLLIDVPLTRNNRGSTLEKAVVAALMESTRSLSGPDPLFVRMPVWSARYAPPRPPDLYLALRGAWDQRFSPVE